jgi:succinyl-diaminopimelate desuccinylase
MKDLADTNDDIGLLLTGDEESGGFDGVKFLLDQGYKSEVVIIPDGGQDINKIVVKEKGIIWLKLIAHGSSAHGSMPWNGQNAILILSDFLQNIHNLFVPHDQHPDDHWVATFNLGKIEGGSVANQVPAVASAWCDIRYTEND